MKTTRNNFEIQTRKLKIQLKITKRDFTLSVLDKANVEDPIIFEARLSNLKFNVILLSGLIGYNFLSR